MTPRHVLKGVWTAYLTILSILAILSLAGAGFDIAGVFAFLAAAALVGLPLLLPAGFAALSLFYCLRAMVRSVRWWAAPVLSTAALAACFIALAQDPTGAIWAAILGPITGAAFWIGAVGWHPVTELLPGDTP